MKDHVMGFLELIKSRRSIRRFEQKPIDRNMLVELVETARSAPAGANIQSLEYIIIDEPAMVGSVFEQLAWAGHVQPKRNPTQGQEPVAYIVVLADTTIKKNAAADAAAAIENMLLTAWSQQIGSCWLGTINRDRIRTILTIPENYKIDSIVALGLSAEKPIMEDCIGDDTRYYLDDNDVLHVPKKPLKKITHNNKFGKPL